MYAADFDYVKASSIEEAISLKGSSDDSNFLAGGHSLIPAMKLRLSTPQKLIDISGLDELKNISENAINDRLNVTKKYDKNGMAEAIKNLCDFLPITKVIAITVSGLSLIHI